MGNFSFMLTAVPSCLYFSAVVKVCFVFFLCECLCLSVRVCMYVCLCARAQNNLKPKPKVKAKIHYLQYSPPDPLVQMKYCTSCHYRFPNSEASGSYCSPDRAMCKRHRSSPDLI